MTNIPSPDDIERVKNCLAWIDANPNKAPYAWIYGVQEEARSLGLLPKLAPRIGCNCPDDGGRTAFYESAILARQEASGMYD